MKYVLAVSGGVDSVVLLDMLAQENKHELMIAHFEHGIRGESSQEDARFVEALAAKYGLMYVIGYGNLGEDASEEAARISRYRFLKDVAARHDASLVTAHHQDDLVETIIINLHRGTGWRGLAVFGDSTIERPLIHMRKSDIYSYALRNNLEWVEDETNLTNAYLRNRVRSSLGGLTEPERRQLIELYKKQLELKEQIDNETNSFLVTSRYFLTMIDEEVAIELLRALLMSRELSLTRPQRRRLLLAIKTAKAGSVFHVGGNISVQFTLREFIVN